MTGSQPVLDYNMPKKKTVKAKQPEKEVVEEQALEPIVSSEQSIKNIMGAGLSSAYALVSAGSTVAQTRTQASKLGDVDQLPVQKK